MNHRASARQKGGEVYCGWAWAVCGRMMAQPFSEMRSLIEIEAAFLLGRIIIREPKDETIE